jgi:hypothetical protein
VLREWVEILVPLLLPTALYLGWVWAVRWADGGGVPIGWARLPWLWLAGAGVVLLAVFLIVVTVGFGTPNEGVYVPPRWTGGHIVPGHFAPAAEAGDTAR